MPAFQTPEDIANRALQIVGAPHIKSFADLSEEAHETSTAYDKVRERELRRNVWRFATRKAVLRAIDVSTQLWTPPTWSVSTTYALGAIVVYTATDGTIDWWQSLVAANVGNAPSAENENWGRYFGPDYFDPFSAPPNTSVSPPAAPVLSAVTSGALGAEKVYVKLTYVTSTGETLPSIESNLQVLVNQVVSVASPAAATGATGYNVYASSVQGRETLQTSSPISIGTAWQEPNTGLVIGQFPPTTNSIAYRAGELTTYGGAFYLSLVDNNTDTPPTQNWLSISGSAVALQILYPLGAGPRSDLGTLNAFRLPHGYLRRAPTDQKGDRYNVVGFATAPAPDDWVFEGNYFTSFDSRPKTFRFVANFVDINLMDPMFCEGFAAAIAMAVAPDLENASETAKADAAKAYKQAMGEARMVNGIEMGSTASPIDPWIVVRF